MPFFKSLTPNSNLGRLQSDHASFSRTLTNQGRAIWITTTSQKQALFACHKFWPQTDQSQSQDQHGGRVLKRGAFLNHKNLGHVLRFGASETSAPCSRGVMMSKNFRHTLIKKHLTYTVTEAAETLGASTATIRNWIKQGLPIQKDRRPYLILGQDLRDFIQKNTNAKRYKLQNSELNCFKCNAGRRPINNAVVLFPQTAKTSRLQGKCDDCGGKVSRVISNALLSEFSKVFEIAKVSPTMPNRDLETQPTFPLH